MPQPFALESLIEHYQILNSQPSLRIGEQISDQLTKWYLNSTPNPPHKKSRWSFSMRLATLAERGKRDIVT
jgi:hypothetical protein